MPDDARDRRRLLQAGAIGLGAVIVSGALWKGLSAVIGEDPNMLWKDGPAVRAKRGASPYGDLRAADGNGIQLPEGFTSRVIARSGEAVPGTGYEWHRAPDGGACFANGTGWIYVSNSEVLLTGGASAVRFDGDGSINDAYAILRRTHENCAGGATPWNTWLSCEEVPHGRVFETDPWGVRAAEERGSMGRFTHEAAACDPDRRVVYLTEDEPDGCFYRFVPDTWGDLNTGPLQVLCAPQATTSGLVTWQNVPDLTGLPVATRKQVDGALHFDGGEGCWYHNGVCYFTTKGDGRVWAYDAVHSTIQIAYDDDVGASLSHVDNITGAADGDLYVAEDGGNMEICIITAQGAVAPFLRVTGQATSELTGPAFNPAGNRLYFSSQRGTSGAKSGTGGITYEITGPFTP